MAFPGQPGNPVGFAAAPGYPGSLTPHANSGFVSGGTYRYLDIDAGTGGTLLSGLTNVTLVGCRIQSNARGNYNVQIAGGSSGVKLSYCSIVPRVALVGTTPPGAAWPSAGLGGNTTKFVTGINCIAGANEYQYGVNLTGIGGPITLDHCDIWGFGNAIVLYSSAAQVIIDNCWIHDACNADESGDHTDGVGYLNGGVTPKNVTVSNCTIASLGNTNALAWQGGASQFVNIRMIGNYLSGFGYTLFMFGSIGAASSSFTDNVLATDIQALWGPNHDDSTSKFTGGSNVWRRNKLKVYPGSHASSGATFAFTAANDGMFIWPNSSLHTTDFAG